MSSIRPVLKLDKNTIAISVIVITHLVGLIGFLSPYKEYFILLTPVHLLISTALLLFFQKEKNLHFIITVVIVYLVGFLVELVGVNTGLIFGEYQYDTALGLKLFNTPLLIGVNWLMLILAIGSSLNKLPIHWILKAVFASLTMTALDYLIEPIAIEYDFWHWKTDSIPFQNYLGWLITSFLLFLVYYKTSFKKENNVGLTVFFMQLLFFGVLNLFN